MPARYCPNQKWKWGSRFLSSLCKARISNWDETHRSFAWAVKCVGCIEFEPKDISKSEQSRTSSLTTSRSSISNSHATKKIVNWRRRSRAVLYNLPKNIGNNYNEFFFLKNEIFPALHLSRWIRLREQNNFVTFLLLLQRGNKIYILLYYKFYISI